MYKNRKPIIMAVLCALIVVMAIGFALLQQELTITGTSHIDSNWNIRITNIRVKNLHSGYQSGTNAAADVSGSTGCTTKNTPCNSTTANFEAKLVTPGDYIIYEVTITNSGNLDGVVSGINLSCTENDAITCTTTGLAQADTIAKNGGTNTVEVKVEYNSATTTQPVNTSVNATLTINYQQDLGQVTPPAPSYDYAIGDTITYKDTTWKVIKNSPSNENYVTLMKETVLTAAELGLYAYNPGICNEEDVNDETYGCTEVGQQRNAGITYNTMEYTWTSTCHNANHGYSEGQYDCDNTNSYTSSKIKEAIEAYATSKGMMSELGEIDGYKVRLITRDELINNLEYGQFDVPCGGCGAKYWGPSSNTPSFVYSSFGENQNNVYGYWTMTPHADNTSNVWYVPSGGNLNNSSVNDSYGVRPVINLLKSNIPAQS